MSLYSGQDKPEHQEHGKSMHHMQQKSTSATETTTDAARPPTHPWATIGMDICEQDQCKYLLVVDYYSRFPVFITLPDTSATTVCEQFTQILTKYGLSTTIMSDRHSQIHE